MHKTTTEKLGAVLDDADDQGLEVRFVRHTGGRDWVLVTRPGPILGPAGRRVFQQRED